MQTDHGCMPDFDFSTPDQIIARREEAKQSEHDARLALILGKIDTFLMAKWDADTRPLMCDAPYVDRDLRADVRNALARAGWRIEYVDPPASIDSAEWLMQPHATSTIWAPTDG